MSSRRKRAAIAVLYRDGTDSNRLKPVTGGEVRILPGGAWINDTVLMNGSGVVIGVHDLGELEVGNEIKVLQADTLAEIDTGVISEVRYAPGIGDQVVINSMTSSITSAEGMRIVVNRNGSDLATLYEFDEGITEIANPWNLAIGDSGKVHFYTEHDTFDVYISGSAQVADGYVVLGVDAGASESEPVIVKSESLASAVTLEPSMDSGLLTITSNTNDVYVIEGATSGKLLVISNKSGGDLSFVTTASEVVDRIQDAAAPTIVLADDKTMLLVGHTVGSSPMWSVAGTNVVDIGDLGDVNTVSPVPTDGDVLFWDVGGGEFVAFAAIGSSSNLAAANLNAQQTRFYDATSGFHVVFAATALTANRTINFPDAGGAVLVNTANGQDVTGQLTLRDNTAASGGIHLYSATAGFYTDFDGSAWTANRTLTFPDADVDLQYSHQERYISAYMNASAGLAVMLSGVWNAQGNNTWAINKSEELADWVLKTTPPNTGRITWLGADVIEFEITVSVSLEASAAGRIDVGLAWNGGTPPMYLTAVTDGTNPSCVSFTGILTMTNGDYVDLQFKPAGAVSVQLNNAQVVFREIEVT